MENYEHLIQADQFRTGLATLVAQAELTPTHDMEDEEYAEYQATIERLTEDLIEQDGGLELAYDKLRLGLLRLYNYHRVGGTFTRGVNHDFRLFVAALDLFSRRIPETNPVH